jgi:hypothetical protein
MSSIYCLNSRNSSISIAGLEAGTVLPEVNTGEALGLSPFR